jgi:hypothetical protein
MKTKTNNKANTFYSCIPNGDYNNDDVSLENAFSRAEFELTNGCQNWVLISKDKLSDEQYSKLLDVLSIYPTKLKENKNGKV